MAAGIAASKSLARVLLLDKNKILGKKIRITGKGRCNVCNNCGPRDIIDSVPGNGRFLYSAVNGFTPQDLMSFLEEQGIALKTERGNRVFPVSDDANDIADCMENFARKAGVQIAAGDVSGLIIEDGCAVGLRCGQQEYRGKAVLISSGGASYRGTGSTGDGYTLAKSAGHSIIEPRPSLVALCSDSPHCKEMQGLALKNCGLRLIYGESCIYEDFGELLFTHFGISGPTVLSASAHMRENGKPYTVLLDLKPALSFEQLEKRLLRDFGENQNRNFSTYMPKLLPSAMAPVMAERTGISPDTKLHSITREQRHSLISALKSFAVPISGFRPLNEAIVTAGGVSVREINPKTMESKLVKGLYFAGEVIDVDAYTGGFNLQIAFSTGRLAGESMAEAVN